jgi:ATP-binding cassette subfamily C protein CydD
VFGRARPQQKVIAEVTASYRSATMATLRVAFLSALVLELTAAVATALVAVEVGLRLLYGHMSYESALLVLLLTPEAFLPLRAVAAQFHASMDGAAAAGRVLDILEVGTAPRPRGGSRCPPPDLRAEELVLDAITVTYPGRPGPALQDIDLVVRPGERIALTGPSGAGKSTLLALLLGFVQPAAGTVRAGRAGLDAIDLDRWRDQIAWVPQRPHLFAGSVASNIALGSPAASLAAIERAAGLAGAAGFIEALPGGYHAELPERGLALSAGQRQKIALARAFLRDAPLLLLDEPTAHLDPESARHVRAAIENALAGRTLIVVSHRQDLAGAAGRVVRVDHGRLGAATPASGQPRPLPAAATG